MIKGTKQDFMEAIKNRDIILKPNDGVYGCDFEMFLNESRVEDTNALNKEVRKLFNVNTDYENTSSYLISQEVGKLFESEVIIDNSVNNSDNRKVDAA